MLEGSFRVVARGKSTRMPDYSLAILKVVDIVADSEDLSRNIGTYYWLTLGMRTQAVRPQTEDCRPGLYEKT